MSAEITKRLKQDIKGKFTGPDNYPVCPMARLGRSLPSGQSDALQRFAYKNEHELFSPRVRINAIPNSEVRPSSAVTVVTHYASRRDLQDGLPL